MSVRLAEPRSEQGSGQYESVAAQAVSSVVAQAREQSTIGAMMQDAQSLARVQHTTARTVDQSVPAADNNVAHASPSLINDSFSDGWGTGMEDFSDGALSDGSGNSSLRAGTLRGRLSRAMRLVHKLKSARSRDAVRIQELLRAQNAMTRTIESQSEELSRLRSVQVCN